MFQRYQLYFIFSALLLSFSCNKNNKILDLTDVNVEFDINRYEKKFFAIDTNSLILSLKNLRKEDSIFFDFYTLNMMRFGEIEDTITPTLKIIDDFVGNKYSRELADSISKSFEKMDHLENELTESFKYFKYYFPKKKIPEVYTVNSQFSYGTVTLDSTYLVICLDMYLGKNFKFYNSIDKPNYMIKRLTKEYLVPNAMEVIYKEYFGGSALEETNALVYTMIENGKKLYFMESMMPKKDLNIIIGYTKEQFDWCMNSESEIWSFYNEHDLFYSKNYMEHKKHVSDAPKTAGMPNKAPGNVGSWVGWQIVNQYMKNANGTISLNQLLETDAETILVKSKYKPK